MNKSPKAVLDRRDAVPQIIGDHEDFLIISGLAGTAQDVADLTKESDNSFIFGGAMGGALMAGFGLALAQPTRRVLVAAGDGDVLMSLGSLATIGAHAPKNLAILCVDNELYGETGNQRTHTGMGVDLRATAQACGIKTAIEVRDASQYGEASRALRGTGPSFVIIKVDGGPSRRYPRSWDAVERKLIFRRALLGVNPPDQK
jgi:thiamine pyrophosphate-dependent acetolactate synthase large subunit-like protein